MAKIKKVWTNNEAVEMMNRNTSNALNKIAQYVKQVEMDAEEIIDYLIEVADELEAQAVVVSLRDELNFNKPIDI